jgi:sugar phosphate isomerase/epimerase
MAEAFSAAGLRYESMHAPWNNINAIWLDGEAGDAIAEYLISYIGVCARQGVPVLVVHLSSGDGAPPVSDIGRKRFDRIVNHAVRTGVKLALENQRKLANLAFLFELYEKCPAVGFCWDCGHEQCFAGGRRYLPLFGDRLLCTHIHDNFGKHNKDLHLIPFDGSINFSRAAAELRESGYKGTLTLEVLRENSSLYKKDTPEAYFSKAFRAAVKLRDMIDD